MAAYTRITYNERLRIRQMLEQELSTSEIARQLRRSKSTISTELRRKGMSAKAYAPSQAQADANFKRKLIRRKKKITGSLEAVIQLLMLEKHWSPEQISNTLKLKYPSQPNLHVSHEAIYKHVYRSEHRKIYCQALRSKRKARRKRKPGGVRRGGIRNRVSIHSRDSEVETRQTPGHWEGDLVIGKGHKSAIGTLVERTTRYTIIVPLQAKDSESVVEAFVSAMKDLPPVLKKSLTYDQGSEMARHEQFTIKSGIPVYFADPGSPWQRGTNENTNGLIREFFPKGTDFTQVTIAKFKHVEELLNTRPRDILGYSTPSQQVAGLVILPQNIPKKTSSLERFVRIVKCRMRKAHNRWGRFLARNRQ